MSLKLAFLGTPEFAVPCLDALVAAGFDVRAVLCRADKPHGRGNKDLEPPIKLAAARHGLRVLQPTKLRKDVELQATLKSLELDVVVVVAYGMLVPTWLLELAPAGCINVHGSILPLLRGAAPIQHAILQGFATSGISLMKLDEGMDTGPVFEVHEVPIGPNDTAGELHDRLAALSAAVLPGALRRIVAGEVTAKAQDDTRSTLANKFPLELEEIKWAEAATRIDRVVRAQSPRPGSFTTFRGKRLKVFRGIPVPDAGEAGTIVTPGKGVLRVGCGEGSLELTQVQLEGKRAMSAAEFLTGHQVKKGETLGGAAC